MLLQISNNQGLNIAIVKLDKLNRLLILAALPSFCQCHRVFSEFRFVHPL